MCSGEFDLLVVCATAPYAVLGVPGGWELSANVDMADPSSDEDPSDLLAIVLDGEFCACSDG